MSRNRRGARGWMRLILWAVFSVTAVTAVFAIVNPVGIIETVSGTQISDDPILFSVVSVPLMALYAFLAGLITARAARLHGWRRLVPGATAFAGVLVFMVIFLIILGAQEFWDGDVGVLASVAVMPLGALAGVALADHLTREEGQSGDVGEPHPTQQDSPVG